MLKRTYYSPEEVAEYYGVSVETIRRMCREGTIPGVKKIGRQYRIPATYLEETPSVRESEGENNNKRPQ